LVRTPSSNSDITDQLADTAIKPSDLPKDVGESLASEDVVTLLVRDADGGARRLRVPLIESVSLDRQLGSTLSSLPSGFQQDLERRGLDMQSRRRYAPLYFEQHDQLVPMMVPVDDAYIMPVSRPVY